MQAFADSFAPKFSEYLASISCGVALVAATFALHRAALIRRKAVWLLVVATPLIAIHAPPFAPVGLGLFILAVLPVVSSQSAGESGHTAEA